MLSNLLISLGLKKAPPTINSALQMISKRAERLDPKQQGATYVALGGIEATLESRDNRVIFGRSGTGNTHVLLYVADTARKRGELPIYIDMRNIGSNSYIYSDTRISLGERVSYLLRDFLNAVHDSFLRRIHSSTKSS